MRVDLPVCPSPFECHSHDGSVVAVLLEVTLSLIPGSFLKEDRAAFTVTHKKLQSAKHTFSPDKDWMINFGHLCSILLASVREHAGAACPWAGPAPGDRAGTELGRPLPLQPMQLFCSTRHNCQPEPDLLHEKYFHLWRCCAPDLFCSTSEAVMANTRFMCSNTFIRESI